MKSLDKVRQSPNRAKMPPNFTREIKRAAIPKNSEANDNRETPTRTAKILVLFGTRPEAIKLAPVIRELKNEFFQTVVVSSSQHKELLTPFLEMLDIKVDFDLRVMKKNQTPTEVCSRILAKLDKILAEENPDLILVQGDTTTTLAGALAGFNRKIPVGHIEAGLRSGNPNSPFPEEMNRRVISQLAAFHFAATEPNRSNLLAEGTADKKIFVTGNPVVDALDSILKKLKPGKIVEQLLEETAGKKRILLTTHRRESFGETMSGNLRVLREFRRKKKRCLPAFSGSSESASKTYNATKFWQAKNVFICSNRSIMPILLL